MLLKTKANTRSPAIVCRDQDDCDDLDLKLSKHWLRVAIAGVFAGQGMVFSLALNMTPPIYGTTAYWILHGGLIFSSIVVIAFLGGPLFRSTWSMIRNRRLSIEGLFTLSLVGALTGSLIGSLTGEGDVFYELVAIVIAIYTFGRMLGERSYAKLRLESAALRERFDQATVRNKEGRWEQVPITQVEAGMSVCVAPGEAITVDGLVLNGAGYIQETALTGEPLPVVKRVGDTVRAGTYAIDCQFELEVLHSIGHRELDTILDTVESADGHPSEMQTQADALVQRFLPLVVGVAIATGIFWGLTGTWIDAALNCMSVLLVACPCALGLATPLAISQGLLRLAQMGLVSRDGALIDILARSKRIFFDKTGTLSESSLRVSESWISGELPFPELTLLEAVRVAEASVKHPVAQALSRHIDLSYNYQGDQVEASEFRLIPGQGLEFRHQGELIQVGEGSLSHSESAISEVITKLHNHQGKKVFVIASERVVACFVLKEIFRDGVDCVWQKLEDLDIAAEVLTGDPNPVFGVPDSIAVTLGMSACEKVKAVDQSVQAHEEPLFIGDGINDAAAMASARGSIAMHSGASLATSVAMGQLIADRIDVIPRAIILSRSLHAKLKWNLIYAASYNILGMSLAATGVLHPIAAATIMLFSSFAVSAKALSSANV